MHFWLPKHSFASPHTSSFAMDMDIARSQSYIDLLDIQRKLEDVQLQLKPLLNAEILVSTDGQATQFANLSDAIYAETLYMFMTVTPRNMDLIKQVAKWIVDVARRSRVLHAVRQRFLPSEYEYIAFETIVDQPHHVVVPIVALDVPPLPPRFVLEMRRIYRQRRDALGTLNAIVAAVQEHVAEFSSVKLLLSLECADRITHVESALFFAEQMIRAKERGLSRAFETYVGAVLSRFPKYKGYMWTQMLRCAESCLNLDCVRTLLGYEGIWLRTYDQYTMERGKNPCMYFAKHVKMGRYDFAEVYIDLWLPLTDHIPFHAEDSQRSSHTVPCDIAYPVIARFFQLLPLVTSETNRVYDWNDLAKWIKATTIEKKMAHAIDKRLSTFGPPDVHWTSFKEIKDLVTAALDGLVMKTDLDVINDEAAISDAAAAVGTSTDATVSNDVVAISDVDVDISANAEADAQGVAANAAELSKQMLS